MHRQARRRLMERRGGYNDGPGGSTLDSQGNAFTGGGYGSGSSPGGAMGGGGYDDGDDPFSAYAARVRQLESGGNPNAITGHNYGTFQFGPEEMRKYGITDWRNQGQQYGALNQEYAEHSRLLRQSGLPVTPENLYLTHQQGVGGGPALLSANPSTPAWQVLRKFYPSDAIAQKAISGNIPSNNPLYRADPSQITAGQFVNLWQNKYGGGPGGVQTAALPPPAPAANAQDGAQNAPTGLLGGMGGNPMMGLASSLLAKGQQQAPQAPGFAPPGGPLQRPNVNPQMLQQQLASLQGILHPQFQSFTG